MKKNTILLSMALSALPLSLMANDYIVRVDDVKISSETSTTENRAAWVDFESPFDCGDWTPLTGDLQEQTCKQKQTQVVTEILTYEFSGDTKSTTRVDERTINITMETNKIRGSWVSDGSTPVCDTWLPATSSINEWKSFTQNRTCQQGQEQNVDVTKSNTHTGQAYERTSYIDVKTESIPESQASVGTKIVRNLCSDIKKRNPSYGSKNYTVDVDGVGSAAPRTAYCDMSDGGWTLYDGFGTKLVKSGVNSPGYNAKSINSVSALSSAGYTHYLTTINTSTYTRSAAFMQFFYSSGPQGYIRKAMPSWNKGVRVTVSNKWYGGKDVITFGSTSKTLQPYAGTTYYTFSGGAGNLTMKENGILWVDSVWVK